MSPRGEIAIPRMLKIAGWNRLSSIRRCSNAPRSGSVRLWARAQNDRTDASERPRYPILLRLPKGFRATSRFTTVRPTHGTKPLSVVPGARGVIMTPRCFGHLRQVLHCQYKRRPKQSDGAAQSGAELAPVLFIFLTRTHSAGRGRGDTGIIRVSCRLCAIRATGFRYASTRSRP
jgi:hypothetical protein